MLPPFVCNDLVKFPLETLADIVVVYAVYTELGENEAAAEIVKATL